MQIEDQKSITFTACAWKKAKNLAEKRDAGTLTMDDIVGAAADAAEKATADLKNAFDSLK